MKKISHHTHKTGSWYLLGVLFKISDEYSRPFYMGVPPGGNLMHVVFSEEGINMEFVFLCIVFQSKPFWPEDKSGVIVLKPTMSNIVSKPFSFNTSHTTVLRISELQALAVDVHGEVEDSVTTIVVSTYTPGIGTIRIENLCENTALRFHQK